MTDEQIHELAIVLEASYLAGGRIGYESADLAGQYMAALPMPDLADIADLRNLYASHVRLANDQGSDQQSIDYIRCKGVIAALEIAYIRGDLFRNWRTEN